MDARKPSITIIGTGALGSALEDFFRNKHYEIRSKWDSKKGTVFSSDSGEYQQVNYSIPKSESEVGELVFITTPDDSISEVADLLSVLPAKWDQKTVVHCSGNLTSDELSSLSEKGAKILSMHPVQTFKRGDRKERFQDIYVSLEGVRESAELLQPIIKKMGAKPIRLDKDQKRILHISAVMASNYLVALMFSTENLLKDAGLHDGLNILQSLVHQTIKNIFEKGPENALTGPIARGDLHSVETHLNVLEGREQEGLYKLLGLEALQITKNRGNLSKAQIDGLEQLLGG